MALLSPFPALLFGCLRIVLTFFPPVASSGYVEPAGFLVLDVTITRGNKCSNHLWEMQRTIQNPAAAVSPLGTQLLAALCAQVVASQPPQ